MAQDQLEEIDKRIEELISDKTAYSFVELQKRVEEILINSDIFTIEKQLSSKAVDMYLKNVITKRNELQKKLEAKLLKKDTPASKYELIEEICNKLEFENKDELIKKVEELENKTVLELTAINNSL